jgi:ABC-2 type transport system ATP-binding protein
LSAHETVLEVQGLGKTYVTYKKAPGVAGALKALFRREQVTVKAVRDLALTIRRGEFVGLLGPNGAGKTTTLKMLTGLVRPSAGKSLAFGRYDPARRDPAYLRRIGMVMGQRNQLNPDLPAMESFRLAQAVYDIDDARFEARLDQCLGLFKVGDLVSVPVRKLSLGERMKMELVLAILHEPELLFLDEPTIGLDFNAARQVREFLAEANRALGITIVLTSHYTKDIEELCRRVVLVNHGRLVYDGPLAEVDERLQGQKTVTLTAVDAAGAEAIALALVELASCRAPVTVREGAGGHQVSFDVATRLAAGILARVMAIVGPERVIDVKVGERPIDEIFGEIFRQGDGEAGTAGGAPA